MYECFYHIRCGLQLILYKEVNFECNLWRFNSLIPSLNWRLIKVLFRSSLLGDGGGAFQIDSTQGVIRTLLRLDRETIPLYQLTVVAADKGRPSLSSSVKVKITLKDVRDSPPKFTKDPYIVFKREDIKERSDVVQVEAVSQDDVSQSGRHPIVYSIISGNDL